MMNVHRLSPPGTIFPLVYYFAFPSSEDAPPSALLEKDIPLRYAGLLTVSEDYAVQFFKHDGTIWPVCIEEQVFIWKKDCTRDAQSQFNQVYNADCDGNFFCYGCVRAPSQSWNALSLLIKSLFTREYSKAVLTMGRPADPAFIPSFAWSETDYDYECTNLQPGMNVLGLFDVQQNPVGILDTE